MSRTVDIAPIRVLPDDVANKIAAGEVVERPASVVKELVENALDAGATRITVRLEAAGRRIIEVTDNGHGMSEQNALLAIERHATSKIRTAGDLEKVLTMGFRGEALASIASVSRFDLVTRRAKDEAATRLRVSGGVLQGVEQAGAPVGTRITVSRLYFNTPVRAKFLKGITTELGHCIDIVQRHALARPGVGFQFFHNDKPLLDVPEHARLRERIALIWGLTFVKDMVEIEGERAGLRLRGMVGLPGLTRGARSHQFFFMNQRPVVNRTLLYGFEEAYRGLITVGRHPVGVLMLEAHARFVDVNIHPTKREIRFREERPMRDAVRDLVRHRLAELAPRTEPEEAPDPDPQDDFLHERPPAEPREATPAPTAREDHAPVPPRPEAAEPPPTASPAPSAAPLASPVPALEAEPEAPRQTDLAELTRETVSGVEPAAVYEGFIPEPESPMQLFDTYLLVPSEDRLLIIDQHALHERLNYDSLMAELKDHGYESQQLVVPIVVEVAPSQVRLVESSLDLFSQLGIEMEPFGGNSFQVVSICHLYEESRIADTVYRILDEVGQGDLFDREDLMVDLLRMASRACKASVRAGDRLTSQERRMLLEGFRRLRPPYTCPHGRPIITELTLRQMEKSFRRVQ